MGGVCSSISSFVSIALDALERISLCTVCAMLTCCLLFTIISVMVMGVGIGYHYCFVQNSVDAMAKAAKAAGALRSGPETARQGHVLRSVDRAVKRGFAHRMARREAELPLAGNNPTLNNNLIDTTNITETNNNNTDTTNLTANNFMPPFNYLTTLKAINFTIF